MKREISFRKSSAFVGLVSIFIFLSMGYYIVSYIQANRRLRKKHMELLWKIKSCSSQNSKCVEKLKMCHNNEDTFKISNRDLQHNIKGKENDIASMTRDLNAVKTRLSNAYSFFVFVKDFLGNTDDLASIEKEVSPVTVESLKKKLEQWKSDRLSYAKLNETFDKLSENYVSLGKDHKSMIHNFDALNRAHQKSTTTIKNVKNTYYDLMGNIKNLTDRYYMQQREKLVLEEQLKKYESINSTLLSLRDKIAKRASVEQQLKMYKSYVSEMNSTVQKLREKFAQRAPAQTDLHQIQSTNLPKPINSISEKFSQKNIKSLPTAHEENLSKSRKKSTGNASKRVQIHRPDKKVDIKNVNQGSNRIIKQEPDVSVASIPEKKPAKSKVTDHEAGRGKKGKIAGNLTGKNSNKDKKVEIKNRSQGSSKSNKKVVSADPAPGRKTKNKEKISQTKSNNVGENLATDPFENFDFDELDKEEPDGVDDTLDNHGLSILATADDKKT